MNRAKGNRLNFPVAAHDTSAMLDALLVDPARVGIVEDGPTTTALLVEIATRQIALAAVQSALVAAMSSATATADDNLTIAEAAERLGVRPQWLYRHSKTLSFAKKLSHRQLRFSSRGIERWQKMKSAA